MIVIVQIKQNRAGYFRRFKTNILGCFWKVTVMAFGWFGTVWDEQKRSGDLTILG